MPEIQRFILQFDLNRSNLQKTMTMRRFGIFTLFLFFLLALVSASNLRAQDTLVVLESMRPSGMGTQPCFSILVPQRSPKEVSGGWKKYMRKETKKSVDEEGAELVLPSCILPSLGTDSLSVYAQVQPEGSGSRLYAFFQKSESSFVSGTSDEILAGSIRKFLLRFGTEEYKKALEDDLENEQKKLSQLETGLQELENNNVRSQKKIHENERSIDRLKSDIKLNEKEQDLKADEVLRQKLIVEAYQGSSEGKDAEEKKLRELNKQKKRLLKENENMHSTIDDLESKIKEYERSIDKTTKELIPGKNAEITAQKVMVKMAEEKLKNIR